MQRMQLETLKAKIITYLSRIEKCNTILCNSNGDFESDHEPTNTCMMCVCVCVHACMRVCSGN
jgi:hypothetical protein